MTTKNFVTVMRDNKTLFIIIAVVLFLVELEIFALAAMKSGRQSRLQVVDSQGNVIHETDGKNLSQFNKYYFEKTFGSLDQYQFKLTTREVPFPFRAWFAAAVGIPVGAILLFAFVVRAFQTLFFGEELKQGAGDRSPTSYETRFEKIVGVISRFNIFTIGFLIFLAVFCYWVIPNLIIYTGRLGVETLTRYKWVFLIAGAIVLGLVVWVIYLKYLLAKKSIDSQIEIEKHRLQLEFHSVDRHPLQLEYNRKNDLEEAAKPPDLKSPGDRTNENLKK